MYSSGKQKADNISFVRKWIVAVNSHDLDKIAETLDDNYMYSFPNGSMAKIKGKADDLKEWGKFFEGFPDARFEEQQLISENEFVVAVIRMTGINSGPLNIEGINSNKTIPSTGKKIDIETCGIYTIRDNKIVKLVRYWDSAELLRQIGLL